MITQHTKGTASIQFPVPVYISSSAAIVVAASGFAEAIVEYITENLAV